MKTEKPCVKTVLWGSSQHCFHMRLEVTFTAPAQAIYAICHFEMLCLFASIENDSQVVALDLVVVVGLDGCF